MMATKVLTTADYEAQIAGTHKLILVDFWNSDCGVCKNLAPIIDEIAEECEDVEVFSVHAEENPEIGSKYLVMTVPTLLFIKDGSVKKRTIGFKSKDSILDIIDSLS